jgi:myo-inositol-1(or 4)-monophosphatase
MVYRSALINVMVAAAQKAAKGLVRDFGEIEHLQVSRKGPADFVSNADRNAEETLYRELHKARPKYGFLMEERGEVPGDDTSNRWVVDPLDGTTNFLHSLPHFAISIALERDGEFFAGVIYAPIHNEMYWAERGQGAFLNERRLRVSARTNLEESVLATGIPFKGLTTHEIFLRQLDVIMPAVAGVRRFGSAALDLAYVAAGRYDGFWENGLNPWDIGAGVVLVREAGGFVTDLDNRDDMKLGTGVIAANSNLHAPLAKIIRKADDSAGETPNRS